MASYSCIMHDAIKKTETYLAIILVLFVVAMATVGDAIAKIPERYARLPVTAPDVPAFDVIVAAVLKPHHSVKHL